MLNPQTPQTSKNTQEDVGSEEVPNTVPQAFLLGKSSHAIHEYWEKLPGLALDLLVEKKTSSSIEPESPE